MSPRSFADLDAYKYAAELADAIHSQVMAWDKIHQWTVGIQLVKAADSVGANIAEASGRWHDADQRRLLYIARGSLRETEHWLARATTRGLLPAGRFDGQVVRVAKTLSGLIGRSNSRLT